MKTFRVVALLALSVSALPAIAEPQVPDPKLVTSISQAARMCELTQAGIKWEERSADVLAITLLPTDLQPPAAKMELLKACIFTWAYERNVKLDVNVSN